MVTCVVGADIALSGQNKSRYVRLENTARRWKDRHRRVTARVAPLDTGVHKVFVPHATVEHTQETAKVLAPSALQASTKTNKGRCCVRRVRQDYRQQIMDKNVAVIVMSGFHAPPVRNGLVQQESTQQRECSYVVTALWASIRTTNSRDDVSLSIWGTMHLFRAFQPKFLALQGRTMMTKRPQALQLVHPVLLEGTRQMPGPSRFRRVLHAPRAASAQQRDQACVRSVIP